MKKNTLSQFLKKNRIFLIILAIAFIARIIFFFRLHDIWWDSGVYIGMGKYIFSLGKAGLWEHIRPVLWPMVLGAGWKSGLNTIIFGRVIELLLSMASIFLIYLISKKLFDKRTAIFASAMLSFSTIFFYMGFRIYTEIPSVFLILLGIWLFVSKKYYFSGFFLGLAFLTKFPTPLFFIAVLAVLLWRKEIKSSVFICLGFATPVLPFLAANHLFYGNFLLPLADARHAILNVLGCNVLRYKPWYYYFYKIIADSPFNIFSAVGLFYFFKKYDKKRLVLLFCIFLPLAYFTQMHCRDYRYLTIFIPFVIMFSASGISNIIRKKEYVIPALFLIIAVSAFVSISFYNESETDDWEEATSYFRFLDGKTTNLEIWSSNPIVSMYSDTKINKIYYPVYDGDVSASFFDYLTRHNKSIGYVFLDNCGGGIICPEKDYACKNSTQMTANFLDSNFEIAYNRTRGRCYFKIYENTISS